MTKICTKTPKLLKNLDDDGYTVLNMGFIGYVYQSVFNDKWAAFSKYGNAMTDHIYSTPEEAANFNLGN